MASSKLTALASATPVSTDALYFVSDPGGTPVSKKATVQGLITAISPLFSAIGVGSAGILNPPDVVESEAWNSIIGLSHTVDIAVPQSANYAGVLVGLNVDPLSMPALLGNQFFGMRLGVNVPSSNDEGFNNAYLMGIESWVQYQGSSGVNQLSGGAFFVDKYGAGTADDIIGLQVAACCWEGTAANAYGVWIQSYDGQVGIENYTALDVQPTFGIGSVTSYNIRSRGATSKNLIEGQLILPGLPTSDVGLVAGQLWNNDGVLNVA